MTAQEVKSALLEIINEIVPDEDVNSMKGDIPFKDQIELDSMDFLDIIMEIRKRYRLEVPEADYPELTTLDSCVAYLTPKFSNINL